MKGIARWSFKHLLELTAELEAAKGKPMMLNRKLKKTAVAGNLAQCFRALTQLRMFNNFEEYKMFIGGLKTLTGENYARNIRNRDFCEVCFGIFNLVKFEHKFP